MVNRISAQSFVLRLMGGKVMMMSFILKMYAPTNLKECISNDDGTGRKLFSIRAHRDQNFDANDSDCAFHCTTIEN